MEDNSNSVDISSLESEMSEINQGTNDTNEKLDTLIGILKDEQKQEAKEKQAAEKQAAQEKADQLAQDQAQAEADEQAQAEADEQAQAEADAQAAKDAEAQETTETYTELLTDIRDQTILTNNLLAVNSVIIGIVCGLLFVKILLDKVTRL